MAKAFKTAITVPSVNLVAITQPAASATLTIANLGTLATSGAFSITLTATAATNVTLPTSGTLLSNANNNVPANALATNAITLGYSQITASVSTASTTQSAITGLSAAVTVPSGGRKVKVTLFGRDLYNATGTASSNALFTIWDGAVGTGTQLGQTQANPGTNYAGSVPVIGFAVHTPTSGSHTYNISWAASVATQTLTLEAGATFPAFILIETI